METQLARTARGTKIVPQFESSAACRISYARDILKYAPDDIEAIKQGDEPTLPCNCASKLLSPDHHDIPNLYPDP